ncbi:MAG: hypothetical protein WC011_01820 [Candidatus Paceibacterota bacterium]
MLNKQQNNNADKFMLAEPFTGTAFEIRDFLLRKWCRSINMDEEAIGMIAISPLNDIRIRKVGTNFTMSFWAGVSGVNFGAVDSSGGCWPFNKGDDTLYEVLV